MTTLRVQDHGFFPPQRGEVLLHEKLDLTATGLVGAPKIIAWGKKRGSRTGGPGEKKGFKNWRAWGNRRGSRTGGSGGKKGVQEKGVQELEGLGEEKGSKNWRAWGKRRG